MIDLKKVYQAVNRPSNTDSVYIIIIIACLKMFMIWKTFSSNILSYRHDRKNLSTNSESALKTALKNVIKYVSI